jgi:BirA family biotin operon repressor/biotin-[acetyl-CoA-carboxylase] ligase
MARALGVTRTAVWKQVVVLRGRGYDIEAAPRRGYRLVRAADALTAAEVHRCLAPGLRGRPLRVLATVDSTNRCLEAWAEEGAPEGAVVAAETQTAGRGRLGRVWFSPSGRNLYFSILFRPEIDPALAATLPLLAGGTVARTVVAAAPELGDRVRVKWPNDVWIDDRKLAGVLCELHTEPDRIRHVVVGIGLNANLAEREWPPELAAASVSLLQASGRAFDRPALLAALIANLDADYARWREEGLSPFLAWLRERDALCGREVIVEQAGRVLSGRAAGIQSDGALALVLRDGRREQVVSGDVRVRPAAGRTAPR